MKRTFLILAIIMLTGGGILHAQSSFGLKAGLNFASLSSTETGETPDYTIDAFSDAYTGFHVGVTGMFVFRGGFFQPELLYTQNGRDMRLGFTSIEDEDEYFVHKYSHLVLPLHAGAKFGALKIGAGPVFSFLINDWNDLGVDVEFDQNLNKFTLGYQLGAGLQLGNLILDFRYEGNFTQFGDGITLGGQTIGFDTRPQQFILSLGLLF